MDETAIIEQLRAYLPPDRAEAVLSGRALPDATFGAVLFSDISGFTPLTEAVMRRYGARRGGEEFTDRLNAVYAAMVEQIDRFGGSIISFAGDAMTVWFPLDDGSRATATGFAMQAAMVGCGHFVWDDGESIDLSMKVAVSSGTLRRFQAGDPDRYLMDVIAGSVMIRLAACEEIAKPGEVIVDGRTAGYLGDRLKIAAWRETSPGIKPERVAIATDLLDAPEPLALPRGPVPGDAIERLRPWLIPEVARRVIAGQNIFLTELRPAVALFLRFGGIDFDEDPEAPAKLDRYVRWIQGVLTDLEGTLLQLSIGEKGNYLYAAWGAPVAHDDDSRRALLAALELHRPPAELAAIIGKIEIGIARGTMRTGAYGSRARRTYGVLGDDTNLAARLMSKAAAGTTLVSEQAARRHLDAFELQALEPMQVKGKSEPITAYRLHRRKTHGLLSTLQGSSREGRLIGRREELATVRTHLATAAKGEGQLIAIEAEAGMGKTRLLAEIVHEASEHFAVFAGDCPVLARDASYAVWIPIWREFFGIKPDQSPKEVLARLETYFVRINPLLSERAPLLGPVLGMVLPDNELTRSLDAKVRRASLEGLLIECVRDAAAQKPVLLILEECHWIDDASRHLLNALAQAIARASVGILLAHRALDVGGLFGEEAMLLPYLHALTLGDLPEADARELVQLKLAEAFADRPDDPPAALVDLIVARASGNPFFIEEVAHLLKLQEAEVGVGGDLETLELPDSLHSLVLGRIDQMTEEGQTTLKVASVIGRQFRAAMLFEVDPLKRADRILRDHLAEMKTRDVVLPESIEGDEGYLFRHIVIQEVAYETLPFALRGKIHEAIGEALELQGGEHWQPHVHLLAFHFERSDRAEKKRRYLVAAGDASRHSYAVSSAISYYERALPFVEKRESISVLLHLGEMLELAGRWDEAFQRFVESRKRAIAVGTPEQRANCAAILGDFHRKRGEFGEAQQWLDRAREENAALGNEEAVAHVLHVSATLCAQMGRFDEAVPLFEEALEIRVGLQADADAAKTLNNLGIVSRARGDVATALQFYERSLALRRRVKDRREIANSLNNLGYAYRYQKDYERARAMLEESVTINRAVGDRWSTANALTSLAELALDVEDVQLAEQCLTESVGINRELGDRRALAFLLEACGQLARLKERPAAAIRFFFGARALREEIGAPLEPADANKMHAVLQDECAKLPTGQCREIEAEAASLPLGRLLDLAAGRV